MYKLFIETLEAIGIILPKWFFWVVLIVIIIGAFLWTIKRVIKPLAETIKNINDKLDKTDQIDILKENQLRNVEDYRKADAEIKNDIKVLREKINVVAQMIIDMQTKNDEANKVRLKDRIMEAYSIHHKSQIITQMEKEAFEEMIQNYYKSGGNSFVKKVIEPELYMWDVIDDDYYLENKK